MGIVTNDNLTDNIPQKSRVVTGSDIGDDEKRVLDTIIASQIVKQRYAVDSGDSTICYVGWAVPGVATSISQWMIKRLDESGDDLNVDFADGNFLFDNIWDDRESLSYS